MRIALVLAAGMMAALISSAHAAPIECGAVLGPGGRYTLDRDLVCPPTLRSDDYGLLGILNVSAGATLNLKGHTVSCLPASAGPPPFNNNRLGIRVFQGTVKNGTVSGCTVGVSAGNGAMVKRVVAASNDTGFEVKEWNVCCTRGGNVFSSNTATNNGMGFRLRGGGQNLLVDNVTMGNGTGIGFYLDETTHTLLLRNVALAHQTGFFDIGGVENQIIENRSIDNRQYGFLFGTYTSSNVVANVAKRNGETGFGIVDAYGSTLLANVAKRNGRFGFTIDVNDCGDCGVSPPPVLVRFNVATRNQYGIVVNPPDEMASTGQEPVATSILTNVAIDNELYDVQDRNSDCRRTFWLDNTFRTAFGPCIAE
jgi:parallel beta-helix repeat protein